MGEREPPAAEPRIEAAESAPAQSQPALDTAATARADDSLPSVDKPHDTPRMRIVAMAGVLLAALVIGFLVAPTVWQLSREPADRLVVPDRVGGLVLDDNGATHETVERLRTRLAAGMRLRSTVGAVYADDTGRPQSVILVAGAGPVEHPEAELDKAFHAVSDDAGGVEEMSRRSDGPSDAVTICGISRTDGGPMAVCGWADRDSIGIAFFPNRGVDESVFLLHEMRTAMRHRR